MADQRCPGCGRLFDPDDSPLTRPESHEGGRSILVHGHCGQPWCARFVALAKAARVVVSTRRELPRLESGAVPVDLDVAISSLAAELEKQR